MSDGFSHSDMCVSRAVVVFLEFWSERQIRSHLNERMWWKLTNKIYLFIYYFRLKKEREKFENVVDSELEKNKETDLHSFLNKNNNVPFPNTKPG